MIDDSGGEFLSNRSSRFLTDEFLKQQTEPIIRAQEIFKNSIEPQWNQIKLVGADIQTIGQKIEPLLRIQQNISDSVSIINSRFPESIIFDPEKISLISGAAIRVGETLDVLQGLTLKSGLLSEKAKYNFIENPVASSLNFVTDDIAIQQKSIMYGLENLSAVDIKSAGRLADLANGSFGLSGIALESIQESPFLFSQPTTLLPEIRDVTSERISKLEEEIKALKREEVKIVSSEITKELESILRKIDGSGHLIKKFKGARAVIGQNDDSLAQSAESMTRLIEDFPLYLNKNYRLKGEKENDRKEILAIYLGIKYTKISDINHPLINMQHYFYDAFSQIRHGNKIIYDSFEKDPAKYQALVHQAEGFLYQVIKYN